VVQDLYETAGAYVKEMHTKNGLWSELYSATPNPNAQQEVLQLLAQFGVSENSKGVILNRNPDFDRFFLAKGGFDKLERCFHHQMVDVCSWQQFIVRNYGPDAKYKPAADQPHRALGDALNAIDEMKFYRDNFLIPM
jgi:oligoribonuclease